MNPRRPVLTFTLHTANDGWVVSPGGGGPPRVVQPLDKDVSGRLALEATLKHLVNPWLTGGLPDVVRTLGRRLASLLLMPEEERHLAAAYDPPPVLRLRAVDVASAIDILMLPWELLTFEDGSQPVREGRLDLLREIVGPGENRPRGSGHVRVALFAAAPADWEPVGAEAELADVVRALSPVATAVVNLPNGGAEALSWALRGGANIVHLIAHGLPGGTVLLENGRGLYDEAEGGRIASDAAEKDGAWPQVVFLSMCHGADREPEAQAPEAGNSLPFAAAIASVGCPSVVAFVGEVPVGVARQVATAFHGALAQGQPVTAAVRHARAATLGPDVHPLTWARVMLFQGDEDAAPIVSGRPPRRGVDAGDFLDVPFGLAWRPSIRALSSRPRLPLFVLAPVGYGRGTFARVVARDLFSCPLACFNEVPLTQGQTDIALQILRALSNELGFPAPEGLTAGEAREVLEQVADELRELGVGTIMLRGLERWAGVPVDELGVLARLCRERVPVVVLAQEPPDAGGYDVVLLPRLRNRHVREWLAQTPGGRALDPERLDRVVRWAGGHRMSAQKAAEYLPLPGKDADPGAVDAALLVADARVRGHLGLPVTWSALPEDARHQLATLCVAPRSLPDGVIDHVGPWRATLVHNGLLVFDPRYILDPRTGRRWDPRWSVAPYVVRFVKEVAGGATPERHRALADAWQAHFTARDEKLLADAVDRAHHRLGAGDGDAALPNVLWAVKRLREGSQFGAAAALLDACDAAEMSQENRIFVAIQRTMLLAESEATNAEILDASEAGTAINPDSPWARRLAALGTMRVAARGQMRPVIEDPTVLDEVASAFEEIGPVLRDAVLYLLNHDGEALPASVERYSVARTSETECPRRERWSHERLRAISLADPLERAGALQRLASDARGADPSEAFVAGTILRQAGDAHGAVMMLDCVTREDRDCAWAQEMARALLEAERPGDALDHVQRMIVPEQSAPQPNYAGLAELAHLGALGASGSADLREAARLQAQAVEWWDAAHGPSAPATVRARAVLAQLLLEGKLWEEGVRYLEAILPRLPIDAADALDLDEFLAFCMWELGHPARAADRLARILEVRRLQPYDAAEYLTSTMNLAGYLDAAGDHTRADSIGEEALSRARDVLGPAAPAVVESLSRHAMRRVLHRHPAASTTVNEAIRALETSPPWDADTTRQRLATLRRAAQESSNNDSHFLTTPEDLLP